MKKKFLTILIVCIVILASACSMKKNNVDNGEFAGVIYGWTIDFKKINILDGSKNIVDEQLALEIGNAVIKAYFGEEIFNRTDFYVSEPEGQDVFVVSRIPNDIETLGGDYNVAISKKNGEIISVWGGE